MFQYIDTKIDKKLRFFRFGSDNSGRSTIRNQRQR